MSEQSFHTTTVAHMAHNGLASFHEFQAPD
jgi:hypothetical protein